MALQLSSNFMGIPVANAYHHIRSIDVSKNAGIITAVIEVGTSIAAGGADFDTRQFTQSPYVSPSTQDAYTAAYAYLKTLPEFVGAVDC